ncbi:MAG TPA: copper-containing nitrite reductase [Ignavibacteriaceae bacterium]|nr:copper-containing nitrite reductase [Ignavibacteriaceae bacterium]
MKLTKEIIISIFLIFSMLLISSCAQPVNKSSVFDKTKPENVDKLKHVTEQLVAPPFLPQFNQVASDEPEVIQVKLIIKEMKKEIAPGVFTWALTYDGTVPAPIIVAHQYDYVEVTLVNLPTNTLVHNIDFHAATGGMGGGDFTVVAPGQQVTFRFRAIKAGVFVYHCAPGGIMVPLHVVSGMNGAIMILPREGLKDENGNPVKFDKAFYIAQQDYYLPKDKNGNFKEYPSPAAGFGDLMESIKTLIPSHIVFNGSVGALTGVNALKVNVGEKVLFITSSANKDTRIHIIGGHADLYWPGGAFANKPLADFETWPVPGGSAVAVIYEFREPGTSLIVDHNLIEAFSFGAFAQIDIKGKWNDDLLKVISKQSAVK